MPRGLGQSFLLLEPEPTGRNRAGPTWGVEAAGLFLRPSPCQGLPA